MYDKDLHHFPAIDFEHPLDALVIDTERSTRETSDQAAEGTTASPGGI